MNFNQILCLIVAAVLAFSHPVFAECIPADDPCAPQKKVGDWDKSLLFGLNLTNGNSETTLVTVGGNAHLERGSSVFDAVLDYGYGEDETNKTGDEDTTTRNDFRGAVQYDYLFTERAFAGLGAKIISDEIADIDYRLNINPSLGYYLLRDAAFKFRVEGGPSYVFEKVDGVEDDYFAPRIAEGFEWAITCTSKVFEKAEILFDINDSNNYIVDAEAGIEAAISSSLSLVVKVRNTYDNVPAADKENNDIAVISAIKVLL